MPKKIELTGKIFGYWTVLYESDLRNNGKVYWHCKCECGNEKDVSGTDLRNGKSLSCGCYQKKQAAKSNSLELIGKKFGRLTVEEKTDQRQAGMIVWKCLCECGNIRNVPTSYLTSGDTQSCGCYQKEQTSKAHMKDLSNQRFGKLIALEPSKYRSSKIVKWKCKCDCGSICYVASTSLSNGLTRSCGCLKSVGEETISHLLRTNNIPFETQKSFDSCRFPNSNRLAKFDFYINNQYLIEYDGEQHFGYNNRQWNNKENYEGIQYRDNYKNLWCKNNNIPLIRIPYTALNKLTIQDLLLYSNNPFIINEIKSDLL